MNTREQSKDPEFEPAVAFFLRGVYLLPAYLLRLLVTLNWLLMWVWMVGCLSVLALQETGGLSGVYPTTRPITAWKGSSHSHPMLNKISDGDHWAIATLNNQILFKKTSFNIFASITIYNERSLKMFFLLMLLRLCCTTVSRLSRHCKDTFLQ